MVMCIDLGFIIYNKQILKILTNTTKNYIHVNVIFTIVKMNIQI